MLNMDLRKSLIISLSALSFGVNASTIVSKENLAKQCHVLAETVFSLIASQQKPDCIEKLTVASSHIKNAGDFILTEAYVPARENLDISIFTLQYAALSNCSRYIQISHAKFEAKKIKNSF